MSMFDVALDAWITGHYGHDQHREPSDEGDIPEQSPEDAARMEALANEEAP